MMITVYIAINTNRWGAPSVKVLESESDAHAWGERTLKHGFKVLGIDESEYDRKFKEGETLPQASEFAYYVQKDFLICSGDDHKYRPEGNNQ